MFPFASSVRTRVLCLVGVLTVVGLIWLRSSANASSSQNDSVQRFETISARQIRLVDAEGRARLVLAAPLPNPIVAGKEYPRSTPAYGFQFLDAKGNETGGLALLDSIGGGAFCFDYATGEALCVTKTKDSAYITLLDPPPSGVKVGSPGAERIQIFQNKGTAQIKLADSSGKDRIVLSVEADGKAQIQVLDAKGHPSSQSPEH